MDEMPQNPIAQDSCQNMPNEERSWRIWHTVHLRNVISHVQGADQGEVARRGVLEEVLLSVLGSYTPDSHVSNVTTASR
jgi:hypothetical protein